MPLLSEVYSQEIFRRDAQTCTRRIAYMRAMLARRHTKRKGAPKGQRHRVENLRHLNRGFSNESKRSDNRATRGQKQRDAQRAI